MDMQFKCLPFEMKQASEDGSSFEGLVSAFHNIDAYGEIVDDQAFNQDLSSFMAKGFIGGLNHDWDNPIGKPLPGTKVTPEGLWLKGSIIDTTHGMDVRKMMTAGVVKSLSIGYTVLGEKMLQTPEEVQAYWQEKGYKPTAQDEQRAAAGNIRLLTRLPLFEGSPVTVPANDRATISSVKARALAAILESQMEADTEFKTACGNTRLPIAARDHAWDGPAAEKRVRAWANAADGPNAKYRQGFFWYDSANPDLFGSYHLGFADVINGTLTAIPHGIFACAGALQGARGADGSKYADAKPKIETYYKRMASEFSDDTMKPPWDTGKALPETARDFEAFLREAGYSRSQAVAITNHGFKASLRDAEDEKDGPESAREAPVTGPEIVPAELSPLEEEILKKKRSTARLLHQRFLELDAKIAKSISSQTAGAQ